MTGHFNHQQQKQKKMYYCTEPIPNCSDVNIIANDYTAMNKTVDECWADRQKFMSGRVYLAITVFNGIGIIGTTGVFIYCSLFTSAAPSLQKRSVLGTILGAVGHLIFSTCMFLAQSLNGFVGCHLLLWGLLIGYYTWMFAFCTRAYRLRFLFRLNRLKVKYLRMTTSERFACLNDKDYRWYIKKKDKITMYLMKPYILYAVTIIIIIAVAAPLDLTRVCTIRVGAALSIALYVIFIAFIAPFILYHLKDNADAHGIRTELWIDSILGIPIFVIYIIFFTVLSPNVLVLTEFRHKLFTPGNWIVFYTATAHVLSVVMPILSLLPIRNIYWIRMRDSIIKHCRLKKRTSNASALETSVCIPNLSMDSLERCISDPHIMRQLQDLAIRDFSSENLLFYEKYLELENKFKIEYFQLQNGPRQWKFTKKPPKNTNIEYQKSLIKYLSTPIPEKMFPAFIHLYETFIREDTSSQVNISYRARHSIDIAYENLYHHYPELNPRKCEVVLPNSITLTDSSIKSKLSSHEDDTILTMGIFEVARIEVCWNIFNSVYPKLVDIYNTHQ